MAHTSTPWRIRDRSVIGPDHRVIADCDFVNKNAQESYDNLHLIVAAPEMLAALRAIAEFPIAEQDNMVAANMRKAARAAIKLDEPELEPAPSPPDPTLAQRRRQAVAALRARNILDPDEVTIERAMEGRT